MRNKRVYAVATAHLDTVWRWTLPKTIEEFIPDTLQKNFDLIDKYPGYVFNFEGAYRYELIDEFFPIGSQKIKEYVKSGQWYPAGAEYENGDVNIPSPEALIRNITLGQQYFNKEYGIKSKDIFLPDCFGFGWALPSVMRHCNLYGFTTQKLSWGSAYGQPFDLGIWQGPDKAKVFASLDARSYRYKFSGDIRQDESVKEKIARNAYDSSVAETMHLYGTGDWGGSPTEGSVQSVTSSAKGNDTSEFEVLSSTSDAIYRDLENSDDRIKDALPLWDNELLMTSHGAGGYTSRAMSKRLNRKCEKIADTAERALTAADIMGVYPYPTDTMDKAWKRVIRHQFHDDIPGTSIMDVYNDSWNDYSVSLSQFVNEYSGAVGAIVNKLDTSWCTDCAVIVNNPVEAQRTEAVKAHIRVRHNGTYVKVCDKQGNEVPSQVIKKNGKEFDIIFLATVPSVGFKVYNVVPCDEPCGIKTDLKVSEHILENENYKLQFNKNGDIASLIDKRNDIQLLNSPIKMAVLHDTGELNYPSWEMRKEDIDGEPYMFANSPEFEVVEKGSARCAIKVTRHMGYSTIEQTVSLSSKGDFIRVSNFVDWQTRRSMLKATFPLSCSNQEATYDLGLGVIKRPNNSDTLYEVPAQGWADITSGDEKYGVSILSNCKYGWDKPSVNTLRLTCIHTPAGAFIKEARQDLQEIGRNVFDFGIHAHQGSWQGSTQMQSKYFEQPMTAFTTTSRREGEMGDEISLLKISGGIIVRAIKKAQNGEGYIVRINEADGVGVKKATLSMMSPIADAFECYGDEEIKSTVKVTSGKVKFDLNPFEIKTFLLKFPEISEQPIEKFKKMVLDFNSRGITQEDDMRNVILQGGGCSLPREQIPKNFNVNTGGISFRLASKGNRNDILVARGQTIPLPKGMTRLYILAASTLGDRETAFLLDGKKHEMTIHAMNEPIFTWDMAGLNQKAYVKDNAKVGIEFSHCHHPEGNQADKKALFFVYDLNIRHAKELTLPEDNRIVILAMTIIKKFSVTTLQTPLTDTAAIDYEFGEIPPMDKVLDKADFVTIRAGKYQDQAKGGKGKGLKRNNPITNLIRSYTKSEW